MSGFSSMPVKFSPIFDDVIYTLAGDNSTVQRVDIYNSATNQKIGEKRLVGRTSYSINVAAYFRGLVSREPLAWGDCAILSPGARVVSSSVEFSGSRISVPHTLGRVSAKGDGTMWNSPSERVLARNQQEELSLISDKPIVVKFSVKKSDGTTKECLTLAAETTSPKLYVVVVNSGHIERLLAAGGDSLDDYSHIEVVIIKNGALLTTITYALERCSQNKTRLCWWNRHGGVDYFNFSGYLSESYSVEKERIYLDRRVESVAMEFNTTLVVTARAVRRTQSQWLREIISSPQVWMVRGESYITVDVVSNKFESTGEKTPQIELVFKIREGSI